MGSFSIRLPTSQFSHSLNQLIQASDSDSDSPDFSKSTIDWRAGQKVYSRIYRTNGGRDEKRQVKNEDEFVQEEERGGTATIQRDILSDGSRFGERL